MKRFIVLFLFFILLAHGSCKIAPVLAQGEDDAAAIQNVIKIFYESNGQGDVSSALNMLSSNFSCVIDGKTLDYDAHAIFLQEGIDKRSKVFANYSFYNIQILSLDLNGNNAVAAIELEWEGFDVNELKRKSGYKDRSIFLNKETGKWKITSILIPPEK
jgi:hypothetical protein